MPTRSATTTWSSGSRTRPSRGTRPLCGVPAADVRELARALAQDQPSLIRLGVGAQRHAGAPIAYRTIACIPALAGSWRHRGGGLSYIPTGMFGVLREERLARPHLREGTARSLNMSRIGEALTDPALDPRVAALIVWNSNPAAIAPDQERVLEGLAARICSRSCASSS